MFGLLSAGCMGHYGLYHEVREGENLYRIAKAYDVNYQELAEINDLEDPTKLKPTDRVFIPGALRERRVQTAPGSERRTGRSAEGKPTGKSTPKAEPRGSPDPQIQNYRGGFVWPVRGPLSSRFGMRNGNMHDGIDISASEGTPIRASASGRVIYSDNGIRGYGNLIIIKHEGVLSSVYSHNSVNYARRNDFVKQGDVIARVGQTGRASGPHLHFEMRKGRKSVNPLFYLPKME